MWFAFFGIIASAYLIGWIQTIIQNGDALHSLGRLCVYALVAVLAIAWHLWFLSLGAVWLVVALVLDFFFLISFSVPFKQNEK